MTAYRDQKRPFETGPAGEAEFCPERVLGKAKGPHPARPTGGKREESMAPVT